MLPTAATEKSSLAARAAATTLLRQIEEGLQRVRGPDLDLPWLSGRAGEIWAGLMGGKAWGLVKLGNKGFVA